MRKLTEFGSEMGEMKTNGTSPEERDEGRMGAGVQQFAGPLDGFTQDGLIAATQLESKAFLSRLFLLLSSTFFLLVATVLFDLCGEPIAHGVLGSVEERWWGRERSRGW